MLTVFLPCRKGSQRIPDKNVKDFSGIKGGLLSIKLKQLVALPMADKIIVSSNDDRVLEFASKIKDSRIVLDERPDELGASNTTTDQLIRYVPNLVESGDVLWTHVTSPFIGTNDYRQVIDTYKEKLSEGYDSLMTVLKLQGFIWNEDGPISYNREELNWPMTQNIKAFFEIDSGVFLSSINNYREFSDRIGKAPYLYEQDKGKSIDIDWPEDFRFAEKLWATENNR
ncbi:cytidylyltransferase domain-containing protein [Vibrio cyclitrophicus]|uniref:acylneuraminate cytidylyltransferase family protein n=1 Tax=Vibrio cyclitrophicus TaxID=47951 RepID=UPI000C8386DA|nr:acylneuraminate cytidylyltransferase [Vibrio cyclitrophicus]PMJ53049.1 acylneuraminate cytidylyltransferase [Vibrio cyclitrophicus]